VTELDDALPRNVLKMLVAEAVAIAPVSGWGNSRHRHKTGNFTDFGPSQALPSADSIHDLSGFAAFSRALRNGNLFAR
jgi:hypothetical protein